MDWNDTNLPLPRSLSVINRTVASRKKMESGRTLQRVRYKTQFEEATVSWNFLNEKFQIFKGIWVYNLNHGMSWFNIDLPVGGNTRLTQVECRFTDDYQWRYNSIDNVTVTAKIEFREVTHPDSLALSNLITAGTSSLYDGLGDPIEATWTNVDGVVGSNDRIRLTMKGQYSLNPLVAHQWWEGDLFIGYTTPYQYFPATASEQYFRTEHWCATSASDPTPVDNVIYGFDFFSAGFLKFFDYKQNPNFTYYGFSGQPYYEPPNSRIDLDINEGFRYFSLGQNDNFTHWEGTINEDDCLSNRVTSNYQLDLYSDDNLQSVKFVAGTHPRTKFGTAAVYQNNLLTELDLGLLDVGDSNTRTGTYYYIRSNPTLQEVTLGSQNDRSGRLQIQLCGLLDTINITGNDFYISGTSNWIENTNVDILGLKAIVDKLKGDPTKSATQNQIQLNGSPCWSAGELFPKRFGNLISISGITSSATDFTVTTSVNHGYTTGQVVEITSTSITGYRDRWTIASTPTLDTFTVTDSNNYGTSSGGSVSEETNSDTAYVEDTALANNFKFVQ